MNTSEGDWSPHEPPGNARGQHGMAPTGVNGHGITHVDRTQNYLVDDSPLLSGNFFKNPTYYTLINISAFL